MYLEPPVPPSVSLVLGAHPLSLPWWDFLKFGFICAVSQTQSVLAKNVLLREFSISNPFAQWRNCTVRGRENVEREKKKTFFNSTIGGKRKRMKDWKVVV